MLGIASDKSQIGSRRRIRFRAPLLPIAQGTERNVVALGEFFLREVQGPADDLHPRPRCHALEIAKCERASGSARAAFLIALLDIGRSILPEILSLMPSTPS